MKVSRSTRFTTAKVVWVVVAISLIYRGLFPYFGQIESTMTKVIVVALIIAIGIGKGIFVISKSTARTAAYIVRRPEQDWIWLSFHPILYILIPVMIAAGLFVRHQFGASMPALIVGIYGSVGLALLVGVRGFMKVTQAS